MTEKPIVLIFNNSDFFVSRRSSRAVTLIFKEILDKDSYLESVLKTMPTALIRIYSERTGVTKMFSYYVSRNYDHKMDHDDAKNIKTNGRVLKKVLVFYNPDIEGVTIKFYVAEKAY